MANDGAASIFAVAMRVTRLTATGAPATGATASYVTDALTQITFAPEYAEGDDIELKNAAGAVCVAYKAPDTLKRLNMGLTLCTPDPQLTELLAGGTVLTNASNPMGYAMPEVGTDPTPNGVSIEAWSRAILNGSPAGTDPFIRWLFPRVKLRIDERALNAEPMTTPFTGQGNQNPAWATGPTGDWTYTSNRVMQWVRAAAAPSPQLGYIAVAAAA